MNLHEGELENLCRGENSGKGLRWGSLCNRDSIYGMLLLLVTLFAYYPAWNGKPVWDDDSHITPPELRSFSGLGKIWTKLGATQQYYPLVHSVFWIEHRLFGDAPLGYHLLNIFLHALSSFLLYRILRRLAIPGAWLGAALFALHPIEVESVVWISELKNCLSGVFFFGAILTYLHFDSGRNRRLYLASFVLFSLGLLSKTAIAPLPAAMLGILWWKRGRIDWKEDLLPLAPFFLAGISFGLFTAWVERTYIGANGREFTFSGIARVLIAGRAIWFYLGKLILPLNLTFIYRRWVVSQAVWRQYLFPCAAGVLALALWCVRRRSRAPLAVLWYFVVMLSPALGFINVFPFRYSFVADHFQYLAGVGPLVLAGAALSSALSGLKKPFDGAARAAGLTILTILAIVTWRQCGMYADNEILYRTTIQRNPECWMAYNNLGFMFMGQGKMDDAFTCYRKALALNDKYPEAHIDIGAAYLKMGNTTEAMAHFQKALTISPGSAQGHYDLGCVLRQLGRTDEAIAEFRRALSIYPLYAPAHLNLADELRQLGRTDEAIAEYRSALSLDPSYTIAHNNLAGVLLRLGRFDEAVAHYRKALELDPRNIEIRLYLGSALVKAGKGSDADACFRKALEVNSMDLGSLNRLCELFMQIGQPGYAIVAANQALALAKSTGQDTVAHEIAGNIEELRRAAGAKRSSQEPGAGSRE